MQTLKCWSCDRGASDSPYTCPKCKARGAWRGPMPEYALEARRASTKLQKEKLERQRSEQ